MICNGVPAGVAACAFAAALAFASSAYADATVRPATCWVDAKTGRPGVAPPPDANMQTEAASRRDPRTGRKLKRVACAAPGPATPMPAAAPAPMWWVDGGALLWWTKSAALPPTLTTFAPGSLSARTGFGGALGVAGTTVLSPGQLADSASGGGRIAIGRWLDSNPLLGLEVSAFAAGGGSDGFSETSGGTPPLRIPFVNVPPGEGFPLGNSSFVLADPSFAAGGQVISSKLDFWGLEANGLYHVVQNGPLDLSLLAGVRYLDLIEGVTIASTETLLGNAQGSFTGTDSFSTRNQFFGAQVGVKAQAQWGALDGSLIAKLAVGENFATEFVNGSSAVSGFGLGSSVSVTPGGIFAQSTNIGQRSHDAFALAPELQAQAGYHITPAVRIFVGYDLLYLSNVLRPSEQIDTTLNLTSSSAISGRSPATLTGAARPEPMFNGSSFWAQGLNVGISYAF